jgi:hypothetical protein
VRRRLFTAFWISSLLLAVATGAAWVRSYFVRDLISFGRQDGNCHVAQSILGNIHLLSNLDGGCSGGVSYNADRLARGAIWNGGMSSYPVNVERHLGFVWQTYAHVPTDYAFLGTLTTRHRLIVIPYWSLAALFAIAPGWRLLQSIRGRRVTPGVCRGCGYDLRATPDRCPECGRVVA